MNVVKLAKNLTKSGFETTIFCENDTPVYKKSVVNGLKVEIIGSHYKYFDLASAYKLSKLLKSNNIGVLFTFHSRDTDLGANVKLFNKEILLIYQQHMHVGRVKKDFLHKFRYSLYDYWITPLEKLANEVRTLTNFDINKIKIIPIGVPNPCKNIPDKMKCRNEFGIGIEKFVFGILGRIDKQKGQLDLVRSFHNLQTDYPNTHLLIVGDKTIGEQSNYYNEIIEYINQHNLRLKISFFPSRNDVELFYGALDCFVLCSASETYGMVTIEAMMSGVPVIATNRGGTPEILSNGNFGLLYEPGDTIALTSKMSDMINNYDDYKSISLQAKSVSEKLYSEENEIKGIMEIIR